MARFHINPETGVPGNCKASIGKCPFKNEDGTPATHYSTPEEARKAYEQSQESKQNVLYTRISKMPTYSPTSESSRSAELTRWAADRYWTRPNDHKEHALRWGKRLQGGCLYCGTTGTAGNKVFLNEHLIPAIKGGITVVGNIAPSCRSCNGSKGSKEAAQFFEEKLEDPNFVHPVFGRSLSRFKQFLASYQRVYLENPDYQTEVDIAKRVLAGKEGAEEELVTRSAHSYIDWLKREEFFPDEDSEKAARDFEVRRQLFLLKKAREAAQTAEERYAESQSPYWKRCRELFAGTSPDYRTTLYSAAERVFKTAEELGPEKAITYWERSTLDENGRVKKGGDNGNLRRCTKILKEALAEHGSI